MNLEISLAYHKFSSYHIVPDKFQRHVDNNNPIAVKSILL